MLTWMLLATAALADRYWDVPAAQAEALVARLPPGAVVVTWCDQCGGDLRILRVRAASVAPGTYDEARRSVLLDRDVLFVGESPGAPDVASSTPCAAPAAEWTNPGSPGSSPGLTEHLDIPYSYLLEADGSLVWLGLEASPAFGSSPPPAAVLAKAALRKVRACAEDAEKLVVRPPPVR